MIIPVDADHPAGGHTFILESGHMIPNLDYPDDLKDACTRALHAHIETKPRRQLVNPGGYQMIQKQICANAYSAGPIGARVVA